MISDRRSPFPNHLPPVHYVGFRLPQHDDAAIVVKVMDALTVPKYLNPRYDIMEFSDLGFSWGPAGDDKLIAQTALAITTDVLGDAHGVETYVDFKLDVIRRMPYEGWRISSFAIDEWAEKLARTGLSFADALILGEFNFLKTPPDWMEFMPSDPPPTKWLRKGKKTEGDESDGRVRHEEGRGREGA
jgi:hypothetical protein